MKTLSCLLLLPAFAFGQSDAPRLDELAQALRPLMIQAIPAPLFVQDQNWGHTTKVPHALHWKGLKPKIIKTDRNDGTWRKIQVHPNNLAGTLDLRLGDLRQLDDKHTFKGFLAFNVEFEFDQEIWESGVRLYAGSVRGRMRVQLDMDLETTARFDLGKSGVPEFVFRLRIARANLTYRDMVITHVPGLGGTAARLIGEASRSALKQWHPSLERRLLERANAAIVKAADTKEIRLGIGGVAKNK